MIRSRKGRFFPDDKIVGAELTSFDFFLGNLYARVCGRIYPAVQTQHTQGYWDDVLDLGQGEFRGDLAHHCVRSPIKDTRSFIKSYCLTLDSLVSQCFTNGLTGDSLRFRDRYLSRMPKRRACPIWSFELCFLAKIIKQKLWESCLICRCEKHAEFDAPIKRWIWLLFVTWFIKKCSNYSFVYLYTE